MILKSALTWLAIGAACLAISACSDPRIGHVQDEAMKVGRMPNTFPAADDDYFADMDYGYRRASDSSVKLTTAEVRGRNTWIVWTFGNDRLWDWAANNTFGAFDLLKILSSYQETGYCTADKEYGWHPNKYDSTDDDMDRNACAAKGYRWVPLSRSNRWKYYGLVNEPCFAEATEPGEYGLWLDKRLTGPGCPKKDPFEDENKYPGVKIGARGSTVPVGSFYGKPSGIVGLRLFSNPDFDEAAQRKWDAKRYYADKDYYNDQYLVRPYRVGMSCGFCHVGPNPVNPPKDPEKPEWANLNSNPGAQYFWVDRIFVWNPKNVRTNFIFQLFHTSLPGSLDTSFVSTDNINNPRTMNAVYNVAARAKLGKYYKEKLAGGSMLNKQFNDFTQTRPLSEYFQPPDTVLAPHVLKDGADSVGVLGALNRVFINIGLFSEEWLLHFRPLVGGKEISPIKIADLNKNSSYWLATVNQTPDMALFFLKTAQPDRLKDALPDGASYLSTDQAKLDRGKIVFAENCARCHSSKQPPNLCMLGQPCTAGQIIENSGEYFNWMRTEVTKPDFLDENFLSTDRRIPITEIGINACSPLATNGIRDNIWDNFTSETYKDLPSVGEITLHNPFSGRPYQYRLAGGGRGWARPASLVSVWSTAPFLQNNSVGPFVGDPSVKGRMESFNKSIRMMLWPETREPKDPYLSEHIPAPNYVQRTTAISFIRVPAGYLPPELTALMDWKPWLHYWLPWLFNAEYDLEIGPIPKGMPVSLLSNIQLLAESPHLEDKKAHLKKLITLVLKLKKVLKNLPHDANNEQALAAWLPLVPDLIEVSKCPDFITNKGHYFGSYLSDEDKKNLIEFLKTF
jgi:hypothetical protein